MSRPLFVCVPGASHSPAIYFPLRTYLSKHSYSVVPISLPSVGGNPPTYDFTEDVVAIRTVVTSIVESGQDVILVLHGYGSLPGSEALRGLGKAERERGGLRGGVTRIVNIMGWLPKEGFQAGERGDITNMFPYMKINIKETTSTIDPDSAIDVFYNDLAAPDAEYWKSKLQPQSIGVYWSRVTYAAWRYIPTTYVLCGRDQCISEQYGSLMLDAARRDKPHLIDVVERKADAGHCVMLGQVEWTGNMLRRAAGERC